MSTSTLPLALVPPPSRRNRAAHVHQVSIAPSRMAELLAGYPVAPDDIDLLRVPREPDRYYGVYETRRPNGATYRARVLKYIELGGRFASAREAARAIVAWYKHQFGARWRGAYRHRKTSPWRVKEVRRVCVWSLAPDRREVVGYRAEIFVRGVPVVVRSLTGGYLFAESQAARLAARAAAHERAGRRAVPALVLWRA